MSVHVATPPSRATFRYAGFTHPGLAHRRNQDAILVGGRVLQRPEFVDGQTPVDRLRRFAVSDGVGGQPHPAAASRLLLENLAALDVSHPALPPQILAEKLHDRLLKALDRQPQLEDAGATLITTEFSGGQISLRHVGDSRGYRVAQGQAICLTVDHTLLNILMMEGQLTSNQAERLKDASLANALDNAFLYSHFAEPPAISSKTLTLERGEVLLLVSDGVTLELADQEIAECIDPEDLPCSARRLFDAVMAKGARDNLSAVLLAR